MGQYRTVAAAVLAVFAAGANAAPPQEPGTPAARWSIQDATALLGEVERSPGEGLAAGRYNGIALRAAIDNAAPTLDAIANATALTLAHDYAEGASPPSARIGWNIARAPIDYRAWLDAALARHDIAPALEALLPQAAGYAGLRAALARCDTPAHCQTIRVNLERWRWLPRDLGPHYIWVNPAAYRLDLVEGDAIVTSHRVIVGKPATPTPTFTTRVIGVTANPWWNVPSSIAAGSLGRMVRTRPAEAARSGYVGTRDGRGQLHIRQRPGPKNALGLVKLEMPNAYSVFIHDTPSRNLFDEERRAFSHGCIRTENPDMLARIILPAESVPVFDQLLASGTTKTLPLAEAVPAYIVYFTAQADPAAAAGVTYFDDVYGRDARIAAVLDR